MYKCKICGKKYTELTALYNHIENKHADMIPQDMSVQQYYYYMKTGKSNGNCVMCKQPTTWNKNTNKYNRFCGNPKCKDEYVKIMKSRMIAKYGKVHLLNDPEKQREMLSKRSISGTYRWSDNKSETTYTGSYELDFLKTLDLFFEWDPEDVLMPSPHTYTYKYEGEDKFYIPDVFIPSLDLEIEIKDGGDNPNNHYKIQAVDKEKERLKDEVLKSQKNFHYVKLTNKNYTNFFDFLKEIKDGFEKYGDDKKIPRIFKIEDIKGTNIKPINESTEIIEEGFIENILNDKKISVKKIEDNDFFISLNYNSKKDSPKDLQNLMSRLIKGAKCEDDMRYIKNLVGKSQTYYYNLLKKKPELKDDYEIYYDWINNDMDEEIKERMKKIKESLETIEEKFEPDKFLLWLDKPVKKLVGGKLRVYHGSSELIEADEITPISFNVGATKHSNPRWSTYVWDNKEDAMKWASAWEVSSYHKETLYIGHNGKTMLGKPEGISDKAFVKELINKMSKAKFYIYECEVEVKDLEVGSCPSIREYTVSKPLKVIKRYDYTLNKEIVRRCFNILPVDEVIKFKEQNQGVKHLNLHRNFILNHVLDNTRDPYRAIMRTDLQQGNIQVGDDLSGYKDSINYHVKKDTYGLKETNEIDNGKIIYESSISLAYINQCLQNDYEKELKKYLNDYKDYYNKMLKEKPHAVNYINEDIKKAIIFIDGLSDKGVQNDLLYFAKNELGDIVNMPKSNKVVIKESSLDINSELITNTVNLSFIIDPNKNRNLFGMNDIKTQIQLENYIIQRDKIGNHCSVKPGITDNTDKKVLEYTLTFDKNIDINTELKSKMNDGIILNSLFNNNDKDYKFIKEACLRLFNMYPKSIELK